MTYICRDPYFYEGDFMNNRILLTLVLVFLSFKAQSVDKKYYLSGNLFEYYQKLKKEAVREKLPIVMITGFEGCAGCEVLRIEMEKDKAFYNKVAKYIRVSTKDQGSYLFYSTFGISLIQTAPELYFINPLTGKAKRINRDFAKTIGVLAKTVDWN